ncbi:MAG TPA: hypothetical protein VGI87_05220 [Solirubrobacteraceae bacterium]|jgi:hypothetical protein
MAVAVVLDFKGGTLAQYDEVVDRMGLHDSSDMPGGGLSHFALATDDGIRIVDLWETREQFEQFAQEQIGPITQAVGVPGPPEVRFYDVHNWMVHEAAAIGSPPA